MPPDVYLASSALIEEDFDGVKTVEEAQKAGFDGVQLFLDPRYRDLEYRNEAISKLKESGIGLVLHLPNVVDDEDIQAAEDIVRSFPNAKVLIHYEPATKLPEIEGTRVGWENSRNGALNSGQKEYIQRVH